MRRSTQLIPLAALLAVLAVPSTAHAFCGFYVGKAGAELFNHASQVVIARDGNRTILTMSNDFQGALTDFALVVPVPTVITKEQIHIGDRRFVERIDSYSAPRLVEYFDPNPCAAPPMAMHRAMKSMAAPAAPPAVDERASALGVKIEAAYTVGEYDIVILSAKQSDGLETWLRDQGYQVPARSAQALEPYVKQGMKFFVAKVNLKEQSKTGFSYLRPIQMAYESEKFMLPIRLGMANSQGEQDLLIYTLTRKGRVESTNYRTENIPSNMDVPLFVKDDFKNFYAALFAQAHKKSDYRALHTEYFWDSGWCDPCADQPLTPEELRGLGVFWLDDGATQPPMAPTSRWNRIRRPMGNGPVITRLHVRYDAEHFPEDLVFQETGDRQNFQARYILRHKATGDLSCEAGQRYLETLDQRHQKDAQTAADLTGWSLTEVVAKMGDDAPGKTSNQGKSWYQNLWPTTPN